MEGGVSADGRRFEKRLPFIIPHGPVCGRWPHQEGQQIVKIGVVEDMFRLRA